MVVGGPLGEGRREGRRGGNEQNWVRVGYLLVDTLGQTAIPYIEGLLTL